jgi:hypothetical protein
MLIATINSGPYKLLLVLHIAAVVVGFGGLVLNTRYTATATRAGGREGAAIATANLEISKWALYALYSVPVWGIGLIGASKSGSKMLYTFGSPWVSIGFLLWFVAVGIVHGLVVPSQRKLTAVLNGTGDGSSTTTDVRTLNSRLATAGAAIDIILVVVLVLMVFKPGQ